jgi:endoglucanase
MALWSYALADRRRNPRIAGDIVAATTRTADAIARRTRADAYRISMTPADFVWGSNGVAAEYGVALLVANRLHPDPAYVGAALENLHYLLGRNAFSLSWVTQLGANPFRHPHHRPSAGDGIEAPWPGLLSGGPNRNRQDAVTAKLPAGTPPARVYVDDQDSYASNEIAINWQASLVFLLGSTLPARAR